MTLKIEDTPVGGTNTNYEDFVKTLKELRPGESFVMAIESHHRMAIRIASILLDASYATKKEPSGEYRIGRVT